MMENYVDNISDSEDDDDFVNCANSPISLENLRLDDEDEACSSEFTSNESQIEVASMSRELQSCIMTSIENCNSLETAELLCMTTGHIPEIKLINAVFHKFLLATSDPIIAKYVYEYLNSFLALFPPNSDENRRFYYKAFRQNCEIDVDLWIVFSCLVKSSLVACGVEFSSGEILKDDIIKPPNCYYSLQFFINVLLKDFEYFSSHSYTFQRRKPCILIKLFWPSGEPGSIKQNFEQLLIWINLLYNDGINAEKFDLIQDLQRLLFGMIQCAQWIQNCNSDIEALENFKLNEIVYAILRHCRNCLFLNSTKDIEKIKLFFSSFDDYIKDGKYTLKWLRARLCENVLYGVIYRSTASSYAQSLSLRKIVSHFILCHNRLKMKSKVINRNKTDSKGSTKGKKLIHVKGIKPMETKGEHKINDILDGLPPSFEFFINYSMYLYALHYLLSDYIKIFDLFGLKKILESNEVGENSLCDMIKNHLVSNCGLSKTYDFDKVIRCMDDMLIFTCYLKDVLSKFLDIILSQAKNIEINISLEIMPLLLLKSMV